VPRECRKGLVILKILQCAIVEDNGREVLHFITITGAEESFKVIVLRIFTFTLDELKVRAPMASGDAVRLFSRGIACPMPNKSFSGESANGLAYQGIVGHRHQQIKEGLRRDPFEQLGTVMFVVCQNKRSRTIGF
jgi:hypothetical protein